MTEFRREITAQLYAQREARRAQFDQLPPSLPLDDVRTSSPDPPGELLVRLERLTANVAREGRERDWEFSSDDTIQAQSESPAPDSDDLFGDGEQLHDGRDGEDGGYSGYRDEYEDEGQHHTEYYKEEDIDVPLMHNPDAHNDNDTDDQDQNDETQADDYFEDAALFQDVFNEGWNEGYSYGFANIMTVYASTWYSKASTRFLLDFISGFSDGLCIPFFLTAGLASLGSVPLAMVVLVGMVQIAAGCLNKIVAQCTAPTGDLPGDRARLTKDMTRENGSSKEGRAAKALAKSALECVASAPSYAHLKRAEAASMMVTPPRNEPAYLPLMVGSSSALGYLLGGLLPLLPYFFVQQVHRGLVTSIGIHLFVSFGFGFARRYYVVGPASSGVAGDWRRQVQRGLVDGGWEVIVGVFTVALAVICAKSSAWAYGLLPSPWLMCKIECGR
jgi:hypothetical protein